MSGRTEQRAKEIIACYTLWHCPKFDIQTFVLARKRAMAQHVDGLVRGACGVIDQVQQPTQPAYGERSEQEYFERNTRLGCILFVGNLPFQTPWQHVKDRFQEAGRVRYTDLIADSDGRPKGSALVTMESPEGAVRAIELFNEQLFDGRRLIVRLLEAGRRPPLVQKERMPLYGKGRVSSPQEELRSAQHATNLGAPEAPFANQRPKGAIDHPREALKSRGAHVPATVRDDGRQLFVGNLPYDCTDAALHDTFQQVGFVTRAEIRLGRNGRPTGVGIVTMQTAEEAQHAIREFDGIEMAGRAMRVSLDNSPL